MGGEIIMVKIGKYRLKAYELLYSTPLSDYVEQTSKNKSYNVLIVGNGWMGNEIFKAVFWDGQSVDGNLNITVASQNAKEYGRQAMSTKDGACMPAFKMYAQDKSYANLRFVNINVEDGLNEEEILALEFNNYKYNYIVVSLGDAENNWIAASELIAQIGKSKQNGKDYSGKIIINVFNEFSYDMDKDDQESLVRDGNNVGIQVQFFGDNVVETSKELDRIARNINFAYAMKYDQRSNKKKVDAEFDESLKNEFLKSPMDYEIGDLRVISNFIGADYTADSSFAAAVHIPMKLRMCKEFFPDGEPLDTLKEAIYKKDHLYQKLAVLEHRRWNAYMITRGFRVPTIKEETELLYHEENKHQDKTRRLHICICDASEKSVLENKFDKVYQEWRKKKYPKDFPSELDRASLRVHQLTGELSRKIDIEKVVAEIKGDCAEYSNLRNSIIKLANDEDHSLVLYQRTFDEAKMYAKTVSEQEEHILDMVDKQLTPMKVYNARTDFFSLDRQLIEMLPFALWFGVKYKTIITVTDGSTTATSDVIIPTLFCAENAVYIGKNVGSGRYKKVIESYFISRGQNTKPSFISTSDMDIDTLYECIESQIEIFGAQNVVINCVPNRSYDAALAIGKLMGKYSDEINVVQYLHNKGIVSYSKDKNIGVGMNNKSYSVSEFIQLMGGSVVNEYSPLYDTSRYDTLVKFFQNYCDSITFNDGDKTKIFNPWGQMTRLFSKIAKDYVLEDHNSLDSERVETMYCGQFSKDIFLYCQIGKTLKSLEEYRIIWNYVEKYQDRLVEIQFDCNDLELITLLQNFEKPNSDINDKYKTLKFIPWNGGLKVANRRVSHAELYNSDEHQRVIHKKIAFMQDLERYGYIEKLVIEEDGYMSFIFRNEETMHLLKTQGLALELIIYHFMRESGVFNDCETGVKISWNAEQEQPEEVLLKELNDHKLNGYKAYRKKRMELLEEHKRENKGVTNEIDVIGVKGMSSVMVSCKTSINNTMQWLYEIRSISEKFQSSGVMAISSNYSDKKQSPFKKRAEEMGIPVWGVETLWNQKEMKKALEEVGKKLKK